jgi:RHS repeat-associated protein
MFATGSGARTSIGQAFAFGDGEIPDWALLGEYGNGSAASKGGAEYIWVPTSTLGAIPVGMYKNGKLYAVHSDHIGTARAISGAPGVAVWQWPYGPFGNSRPTGVLESVEVAPGHTTMRRTNPAVEVNLRDLGQYEDEESGLRQNQHRELNPLNGRFTQFDPLGLTDSLNGYLHVHGSPLVYADPTGLFGWSDMPLAPQWAEDMGAGLGDVLTFGITGSVRELLDLGSVDRCSRAYALGEASGIIVSLATGYAGGTKAIAKASSPVKWANFSHSGTPAIGTVEAGGAEPGIVPMAITFPPPESGPTCTTSWTLPPRALAESTRHGPLGAVYRIACPTHLEQQFMAPRLWA